MASGSYTQVYVKCPFYHRDDARSSITCEGFMDDMIIKLQYRKKADLKQQLKVFCCEHYEKCEIYRAIMEAKYDE